MAQHRWTLPVDAGLLATVRQVVDARSAPGTLKPTAYLARFEPLLEALSCKGFGVCPAHNEYVA